LAIQKIVRQEKVSVFIHVPGTLADRADFILCTLAVNPFTVLLGAAPLHVAGTGTGNLFFTITFRAGLPGFSGHNHTSILM
jgi:hypothetical protein